MTNASSRAEPRNASDAAQRGEGGAVNAILDELADAAEARDAVSVGTISRAIGTRGHGPFLLVPALIQISPIGGIPGLPTVLAIIVLIAAAQIAVGRQSIWLPDPVEKREIPSKRVAQSLSGLRPLANRLDRWFGPRLQGLVRPTVQRVGAALCALFTFAVPPLEVVPFAATMPMTAIALFGLAMMVEDGLLMAASFVAMAIAGAGIVSVLV